MTDYVIHRIKGFNYRVAKFEEGKTEPKDVYMVNMGEKRQDCDCPSYKTICKHIKMLDEWMQQDSPDTTYFDDVTGKWVDTGIIALTMDQFLDRIIGESK